MLKLSLFAAKKHGNSQINCISWLLTSLLFFFNAILYTNMSTIYLQNCFLSKRGKFFSHLLLVVFLPHTSNRWQLRQLEHRHDHWLKAIQETEVLFGSCVGDKDCFCLKVSGSVLRSELRVELQTKVLWFIKKLQNQACYLAEIGQREGWKGWLLTTMVWKSSVKGKIPSYYSKLWQI